jgi:hypothetical protein
MHAILFKEQSGACQPFHELDLFKFCATMEIIKIRHVSFHYHEIGDRVIGQYSPSERDNRFCLRPISDLSQEMTGRTVQCPKAR